MSPVRVPSPTPRPARRRAATCVRAAAVLALAAAAALCACAAVQRADPIDPAALPLAQRANFELFAHRCSRCHSLDVPLAARIGSMDHWRRYVTRMRAQPGSGITVADVPPILSFLGYLMDQQALQQARRQAQEQQQRQQQQQQQQAQQAQARAPQESR